MGGYTLVAKTCDFITIQRMLEYKILAYIGNITENKNQIELVKIMQELKDEKITAILAGCEVDEGQVRNYVIKNDLSNSVCGSCRFLFRNG